MVINSPDLRPLTVGLATFTRGAEGAQAWGVIAAGTFIVIAPLLIGFCAVPAPLRQQLHDSSGHQVRGDQT